MEKLNREFSLLPLPPVIQVINILYWYGISVTIDEPIII